VLVAVTVADGVGVAVLVGVAVAQLQLPAHWFIASVAQIASQRTLQQ